MVARGWRLLVDATVRKVAGSIPDNVNGIFFFDIIPAALWPWARHSGQMSARNISWTGRVCSVYSFTTYMRINPQGLSKPVQGLHYPCFYGIYTVMRRLTTGISSDKYVVRRFRRCTNVTQCTYTNLHSISYCTARLYGIAYCC